MGEEMNVKLHGFWASPYVKRVELALKVKGIPYEYLEEELCNKSDLLLQYNPVHKKVPVLVHNGKPIAESLVILEYINETWNQAPKLLPEDPHMRATFCFWANYLHQLFETMRPIVVAEAEAQKKIIEEEHEKLEVLEEGIGNIFPEGRIPVINGGNLGSLDLVIFSVLGSHKAAEETLGVKILDQGKTPLVYSWITALNDLSIVKQTIPPHDKMKNGRGKQSYSTWDVGKYLWDESGVGFKNQRYIPFDYVEEDLGNKSPLLLKYNPVYKKIPVLVHNGKPITESLVIIEYIDETWKNKPRLLPEDPYKRANVRFWVGYIQLILETIARFFNPEEEAQEECLEAVYQKQRILEGVKDLWPEGVPVLNGENLGLLDIMVVATFGAYKAQEEVLGLKTLDPERNPLLFSWVEALMNSPVVKEIIVPHEKLVGLLQIHKQNGIKFPTN